MEEEQDREGSVLSVVILEQETYEVNRARNRVRGHRSPQNSVTRQKERVRGHRSPQNSVTRQRERVRGHNRPQNYETRQRERTRDRVKDHRSSSYFHSNQPAPPVPCHRFNGTHCWHCPQ